MNPKLGVYKINPKKERRNLDHSLKRFMWPLECRKFKIMYFYVCDGCILTLLVKKTLFRLFLYLECIHEPQVTLMLPCGKPLRTISWRNTSVWYPFSTEIAPTSPKSSGTSKPASYLTYSFAWLNLRRAYPLIVGFSSSLSSKKMWNQINCDI